MVVDDQECNDQIDFSNNEKFIFIIKLECLFGWNCVKGWNAICDSYKMFV